MSRSASSNREPRRERSAADWLHSATQHKIGFNLDLDSVAAHQELVHSPRLCRCVYLKTSPFKACRCLPHGVIDPFQCLLARLRVIRKDHIKVDRQTRHVTHKKIDRRAALQREGVIREHQWSDLHQHPCSIEVGLVHGFSTSRPSADLYTHGRLLPVGKASGSSFATQGSDPSRPS